MRWAAAVAALLVGAEPVFPELPPAASPPADSVRVGGHPGRIALADTGLWVTVSGGRGRNRVVRIDRSTHRVTARIAVRGGPFEIAAAGGAVWVTGNFVRRDDVLHRIDPRTERVVATIPLPGRYAGPIAAGRRAVWAVTTARDDRSSTLVEIDASTNEVVRTVPLPAARRRWVTALRLGFGDVWMLALRLGRRGELPGDVLRFDPRLGRVARIEARALSFGVGPGGAWVTGCTECGVHRNSYFAQRIDTTANAPVGPRIALRRVGFGPLHVGRARVWFGGYRDSSETVAFSLDPQRGRIDRFLRLGSVLHTGMAVDPGAGVLWVARATRDVLRADLAGR